MISCANSITTRVSKIEHLVENIVSANENTYDKIKILQYKSIDQEARSRRNNLIFRGIPEVLMNEKSEYVVARFIEENLDTDVSELSVDSVHRIGAPARGKTRPIIGNFSSQKEIELILSKAYLLKGKDFGINRDYPPEIVQARSRLWPTYKDMKAKNRKGAVFIGYPVKLRVNKKIIRDEFPVWREIMQQSRVDASKPVSLPALYYKCGNQQHVRNIDGVRKL
ncbi:uncharacterized protein LOC128553721 [Mercenaria mercenaria]|uniref:uncharacterized protein LOC128553721 n=1 Tax=Mercenaria mercenaria TaxID=6596 RepID=UPI00234F8B36|nr:uncharacterized protein LOC128553721 [Mercenaria mercenaria]